MSKTPFLDDLSSETSLKSSIVPCWGWRLIWVTESTLSSLVLTSKIHSSPFSLKCRTHNSFSLFLGLLFHVSLLIHSVGDRTMYSAKSDLVLLPPCRTPDHRLPSWLLSLAVPYPGHSLAHSRGTFSHKPQLRGDRNLHFYLWSICVPSIDTFDMVGSR